jgi:hypothetical protein
MQYEISINDLHSNPDMGAAIFAQSGFLVVRNFFCKKIISDLTEELTSLSYDDWRKDYGGRTTFISKYQKNSEAFYGVSYAQPIQMYSPKSRELYGSELLLQAANLLKTNDVFFKDSELHVRHIGYDHTIPAHQDNFYFGLKSPKALTCYIYLSEQSRLTGGLGFLPVFVEAPTLDHELGFNEGFSSHHPETELKADNFFYPDTQPGDVVFHAANVFHRADKNSGDFTSSSISIRIFSRSHLEIDNFLKDKYMKNVYKNRAQ